MQKHHTTFRASELTKHQLEELHAQLSLNQSEAVMLAVDRLARSDPSDIESLRDALIHLRSFINTLEETSFAEWPQWSTLNMEAAERVIAEFGFVES